MLIEDINSRLVRENDKFEELTEFINQTRDTLSYEIKNEQDERAYQYIVQIQRGLLEVHRIHRNLLQKSVELKSTTLQSAQESLYFVGIESFNFKKEIVSRIFSSPLPFESSRVLVNPLLYLEKQRNWSPLTVFSPQRIRDREEERPALEFSDIKSEDLKQEQLEIQQKNFATIIDIVVGLLDNNNQTSLGEVVDHMKDSEDAPILESLLFYHFFIMLHQKSPLKLNRDQAEKELLFQRVIGKLENKYNFLEVIETEGIVYVNNRFSIKNMTIRLEEKEFAAI